MRFTLAPNLNAFRTGILLALACTVFACQQTEEAVDTTQAAATASAAEADTTETKPAPTFFVIPPGMAEKRVWICESTSSDIFHVQHDCPVLVQCKGKGNFRNVTIVRAIEDYGRYNCQTCSKELDHIFDEDMVR